MLKTINAFSNAILSRQNITLSTGAAEPELFQVGHAALASVNYFTSTLSDERVIWYEAPPVGGYTTIRATLNNVAFMREIEQNVWNMAQSGSNVVRRGRVINTSGITQQDLINDNPYVKIPQLGITIVDYSSLHYAYIGDIDIDFIGEIVTSNPTEISFRPIRMIVNDPHLAATLTSANVIKQPLYFGLIVNLDDFDFRLALGSSATILGQSGSGKSFFVRAIVNGLNNYEYSEVIGREAEMINFVIVADEPNVSPLLYPYDVRYIYKLRGLNFSYLSILFEHIANLLTIRRGQTDRLIMANIIIDSISQLLYLPEEQERGTSMKGGVSSALRGTLLNISHLSGYDPGRDILFTGISTMNIPGTNRQEDEASYVAQISGAETSYVHLYNRAIVSQRNRITDILYNRDINRGDVLANISGNHRMLAPGSTRRVSSRRRHRNNDTEAELGGLTRIGSSERSAQLRNLRNLRQDILDLDL